MGADDGLAHVGKTRHQIRRCACGMTDASPRAHGNTKIDIACLQYGGSLHVAGRNVAEHDGWWNSRGCRRCFRRSFPCDRPFDQPQANRGGGGACATPSPAAFCMSLSYFFRVRCYLCVKLRSRTNTVRYGVRYRYPSVRHIQPRMDDGTWLTKPPPVGRSS